jgi:hypothetical protein
MRMAETACAFSDAPLGTGPAMTQQLAGQSHSGRDAYERSPCSLQSQNAGGPDGRAGNSPGPAAPPPCGPRRAPPAEPLRQARGMPGQRCPEPGGACRCRVGSEGVGVVELKA